MEIRMMNDRIAVREIARAQMSEGGIYVGEFRDDGLVKEIVTGEVVAVGPGNRDANGRRGSMWDLAPGQKISYSPVMSVKQVIDGVELTIIRRDSVVGILQ